MNDQRFALRHDDTGHWLHFGDRRLPADASEVHDVEVPNSTFRIRRAQLRFETGILLSVVWGNGTYSTNRDRFLHGDEPFVEEPTTVEVGVLQGDDLLGVLAWQTVDDLARIIAAANAGDIALLGLGENGL